MAAGAGRGVGVDEQAARATTSKRMAKEASPHLRLFPATLVHAAKNGPGLHGLRFLDHAVPGWSRSRSQGDEVTSADVETLYRTYGHSVLRRARQILASDDEAAEILQEIFMGLIAKPDQFDGRSAPSTFLYAVTTHACLSRIRDRKNRSRLLEEHVKPWTSDTDRRSPAARAVVRSLLGQLDEDQARAAVYYFLDGMSHAEIAEVLDCSRRHVGNLLERVEARFQELAS
jgi:RNA polymerase sigma factor (sigma-70 family)